MYLTLTENKKTALNQIKTCIDKKIPFTFTRFGDGEIYVLNRNSPDFYAQRSCKNWGYNYPDELPNFFNDAEKILKTAFIKSDLIGLMDPMCNIVKINYSLEKWSLKTELIQSWGLDIKSLKICDHMLARSYELGSAIGLKQIIGNNHIHIISPNTHILKKQNLSKLLDTKVTYTFHNQSINFNNRSNLLKSFHQIKAPIVFFGTGLNKDYGVILKEEFGKIALDMGATIDAWAGIESRAWFQKGHLQDYLVPNYNTSQHSLFKKYFDIGKIREFFKKNF